MYYQQNIRRLLGHVWLILIGVLLVEGSDINLAGKKDRVLANQVRLQVLELSEDLLTDVEDNFVATLESMDSPFVFEQVEVVTAEEVVERVINYDDVSVLRAVVETFSRRVTGSLVRGSTSFLQLDGGTLIRPGTSFPISIPQAQDRTFTVTVSEITGNSYTLKLGDAEQSVQLSGTAQAGGGATLSN